MMTSAEDTQVKRAEATESGLPRAPGRLRWERKDDELGRSWSLVYAEQTLGRLMENKDHEPRRYRVWARKGPLLARIGKDATAEFENLKEAAEALVEHMREQYPTLCIEKQWTEPARVAEPAAQQLGSQLRQLWRLAKAIPVTAWRVLKQRLLRQRPEDRGQL